MSTSKEAIAAAREILDSIQVPDLFEYAVTKTKDKLASIIQKHYAAKDGEIETLKKRIATDFMAGVVIELEKKLEQANSKLAIAGWTQWEQERDQLKARVSELEYYFNLMDDTQAQIEIGKLMARVAELERALCFFQSVIESGEPWTEHCENTLKSAMEKQK